MRITDVGSVGIGTTSPSGQLGVAVQSPVPAIAAQGWTAPVGSTSDASPAIEANGGNSSTGKIAAAAGIVAQGGSGVLPMVLAARLQAVLLPGGVAMA
jgi:hypothetical protein